MKTEICLCHLSIKCLIIHIKDLIFFIQIWDEKKDNFHEKPIFNFLFYFFIILKVSFLLYLAIYEIKFILVYHISKTRSLYKFFCNDLVRRFILLVQINCAIFDFFYIDNLKFFEQGIYLLIQAMKVDFFRDPCNATKTNLGLDHL